MIDLYGWSPALYDAFATYAARGWLPARVTAHHRGLWRVITQQGETNARLSGRFMLEAAPGEHPVVGDWLAVATGDGDAIVHAVLPRTSTFARPAPGDGGMQVIAANVDVAFLVAALNGDLNLRRLERYLVATRDSGAAPVVVLTKSDLHADATEAVRDVAAIAAGAPVVALSALTGDGLGALHRWLTPGATVAMLGSSGAGKSTLLNVLAGRDLMHTGAIREDDDRGRHTTTHRELFRLAGGALLIDTPGMRELGLLATDKALDVSFDDIAALAGACRFGNCTHSTEPGCAILAALADATLSTARWQAYLKLQRELAFAARRNGPRIEAENRMRWKKIHKNQRARARHRQRNEPE
jgi:ribosome biogenesis GTPase